MPAEKFSTSAGPWPPILCALVPLVVLAVVGVRAGAEISIRVNNVIQVQPTNSLVCQGLRDVLATLTDGSFGNRYLVRLEPGRFTCGAATLFVPKWVAIEGAGPRLTNIIGKVDHIFLGVVHLADWTELRRLSVSNTNTLVSQGGIAVSAWSFAGPPITLMDNVELRSDFDGPNRFAIYTVGGNHLVRRSVVLGPVSQDGGYLKLEYSNLFFKITQSAGSVAQCFFCYNSVGPLDIDCQ